MTDVETRIVELQQSIAALHSRSRLLAAAVLLCLLVAGACVGFVAMGHGHEKSLVVRDIAVIDDRGVVRARLGTDLPDAQAYGGRVVKRGGKAAGLLIYDEAGIERGGYLTQTPDSNAMLTLDSKYRQSALFVAGPGDPSASAITLWTGGSALELRADPAGSRISAIQNGHVNWQMPIVSIDADSCMRQRELEAANPGQNICRERFTEQACRVCLAH